MLFATELQLFSIGRDSALRCPDAAARASLPHTSYGRGCGVGRGLATGVPLGPGVGVAVAVGVGVGVSGA